MRYKSFVYILGSMDVEMATIETLLKREKCLVVHATTNGFSSVRASKAYEAAEEPSPSTVWIECAPREGKDALTKAGAVLIDHHHEGDPGFDKGPEDYLAASSIGQLVYFMVRNGYSPDWSPEKTADNDGYYYTQAEVYLVYQGIKYTIPEEIKYVAASDHCLATAYQGVCRGINVEQLKMWRVEKIARFRNIDSISCLAKITESGTEVLTAPKITIGGHEVADVRASSLKYLKEASARIGVPILSSKPFSNGKGEKIVIQATNPDIIKAFIEEWGPNMGVVNIYGNPYRGMAGGYLCYE